MSMIPKTNSYVEDGKWLTAPGKGVFLCVNVASSWLTTLPALESGIYALAMAMATEPHITRPLDWSTGTLEKRYYNALQDIFCKYFAFADENCCLNDDNLCDILKRWDKRYQDTYHLFVDYDDNIQSARGFYSSASNAKVIILRENRDRWQACCHFEGEQSSNNTPPVDRLTDQCSASPPFVGSVHNQRSDSTNPKVSEKRNDADSEINNTFTALNSTHDKLVDTLEKLVTAVEGLVIAVQTRNVCDKKELCAAICNLTVPVDRAPGAGLAEPENNVNEFINHYASETSTEHDLTPNTPSAMQDTGATESLSHFSALDDLVTPTSHSDVTEDESPSFSTALPAKQVGKMFSISVEEVNESSRL
jgi:hypothetical protein